MSDWAAKRFWKTASTPSLDGGFTVHLDGRPVKTPAKSKFVVPNIALAQAAAAEWDAQEDTIDVTSMPVTRAINAAIDKVAVQFDEVAQMLAAYGDSDVTCYRADSPSELVARQNLTWDPLLDWAHERFNVRLIPVQGVMHVPQNSAALERLSAPLFEMTEFELTAMHDLVSLSGSLIIGLAAAEKFQPIDALWQMSRVDEIWQIEQWGEDEEATEQSEIKHSAFQAAARFLDLSRQNS